MKILITGATGFIGSFVAEEALRQGMEVWAAVRKSSSTAYLGEGRIERIELDLSSERQLIDSFSSHRFDYVVHCAGVTKCIDSRDFFRVNTEGTKHLVNALRATRQPLKRFVYLSSLSVYGPVREKMPYTAIRTDDIPCPNTAYGRSKLAAEAFLDSLLTLSPEASGNGDRAEEPFPFVVLRPTGVYGPREKDYFMMASSIKKHLDLSVGFRPQDLTFIYVSDVVQAVFLALERGRTGGKYFLSDGGVYSSRTFSDLLRRELGNPWLLRLRVPLWILRAIAGIGELAGRATGKATALNNDKYHIMKQRNWHCDIEPARRELGFHPAVMLDEGVKRSVEWYRREGWL
ncbi:MAG: NAD-dependent epimerase/dehydratase family protein [Prevotella sp.]|nr:NAD-dependent epimerase/dehydratase family protein [Prevotella sp.]